MKLFHYLAIVIVLAGLFQHLHAQPGTVWSRTFGGSEYESGKSVLQSLDGGYISLGTTSSSGAGSVDVFLVKTDSNGNEEWRRTFGAAYIDDSYLICPTADSGYVLICRHTLPAEPGNRDYWLIKTDAAGNEQWAKTYGGSDFDEAFSGQQTSDGGYIIFGITRSFGLLSDAAWLVKTDADGNMEWDHIYGGNGEGGFSIQQTKDGGYIFAGGTVSSGDQEDVWLVKTKSDGVEEWSQTFGGDSPDLAWFVRQTFDGGYVMAGQTKSFGAGGYDIWLVKADSNGTQEWAKTYGGSEYDIGRSVQQTADSGYVIIGYTGSFGGGMELWLIKTDASGNEEWNLIFGGSGNDDGMSVQQTADSGYILIGSTESFGAGQSDVWLIKLAAWTEPQVRITAEYNGLFQFALNQNYPNPFNPVTAFSFELPRAAQVSLAIYDLLGREVTTLVNGYSQSGPHEAIWDAGPFPAGIYIARLVTPGHCKAIKMVLLK
ncbi:MAG: T9SS type A sorting domain-containing protein [Fidelibacterota bacterium]|nr:MAG: T9SS type A sorting domain-containing protein [Candidatus Neomarinimicrobiota bacterium]